MDQQLSLGQVASRLGVQLWQVQRVYERGLVPEQYVHKIGDRWRYVNESELAALRQVLVRAGYLHCDGRVDGPVIGDGE